LFPKVITVLRKKYAVGLFWQPVADGQNARAVAGKIAKFVPGRIKYFTEYRGMIGVGSFSMGHRRRMNAAAADVMDAFSEYNSFLAVFEVPQGFWLVASRNGIIIADNLYKDEALVRKEYQGLSTMPDWGILVVPGYWNAPRAEEKRLEDIVTGDSRHTIMPVSNLGSKIFSITILILIFGGLFYLFRAPIINAITPKPRTHNVDLEAAEAYRKKLAMRDEALVMKTAPALPQMPYDDLPDIAARAWQCYDAITTLMQIVPGWNQVRAECGPTFATAHLHRRFGTMEDVYNIAHAKIPGAEVIENSDSDVVINVQLSPLPGESRLSEMGQTEVVRGINTIFQLMGKPADVRPSIETVAGVNGTSASVNIVLVTADSALTPPEFAKIFEEYYAISMPRVTWNAGTRKWNYEVRIYVK